jgi:predicted adenylyl cyclase CyaB
LLREQEAGGSNPLYPTIFPASGDALENIEVEIRTFLNDAQYDAMLAFFRKEAEFTGEDEQENFYFDAPVDLRVQRNGKGAKLVLKKGKMHADHREEIEVPFPREDFEAVQTIFDALGHGIKIKWFRKRFSFLWHDVTVTVDDTIGYGKILELEKMASVENKEIVAAELKAKIASLGLGVTPKSEFDERFAYYAANWEKLVA